MHVESVVSHLYGDLYGEMVSGDITHGVFKLHPFLYTSKTSKRDEREG